MNILIIGAHPDDEVLGMGATIKKLHKNNHKIHLCVVSEGTSAQYDDKKMIKIRRDWCVKAGKILGISEFNFLDFPDAKLDSIPQLEINIELEKIISKFKPKIVYTTPDNDVSKDHSIVFDSTLVACRPHNNSISQLLSYESPSGYTTGAITKFPFQPNVFEDVTNEFRYKIKAFKAYKSEVRKFPHPRSLIAIESLAIRRGVEAGLKKAEAFKLIYGINQ